jgi:exo-beta-1,3-glucanase (GH17 family)
MKKLVRTLFFGLFVGLFFMILACGGGGGGASSGGGIGGENGNGNGGGENPGDEPQPVKLGVINFSAYTGSQDPNQGSYVPESQIKERAQILVPYFKGLRSFGCGLGMDKFPSIAKSLGFKVYAGAWLGKSSTANDQEIAALKAAARAGHVDMAIIGSETQYRGDITLEDLISRIKDFKAEFPDIPVATAETYDMWLLYPELIDVVDVILANYYPFWEGIHIDKAAAYVHARHERVVSAAKGKEVIVSETGWPSAGDSVGQAVPNDENAARYFKEMISWAEWYGADLWYFEAYDEPWKSKYEGPKGAFWGRWDKDGEMKYGTKEVLYGERSEDNWSCGDMPGGPGDPTVTFTFLPPKGSSDNLEGRVWHVDPALHKVAVYIYVIGGWWTKPYWSKPATELDCEGYFVCDITTGGVDAQATKIAVFIIPFDYVPPSAGGGVLPQAIYDNSVGYVIADR